ncbi:MAG TPA: hypothetical protein VFS94_03575 [Gemmatimonadales bacterium]|nr:hypothetical protein [Gemmatimonadales bacterium]
MSRFLIPLLFCVAAPLSAQTHYYARLGPVFSTRIVRDVLFEPVVTKPGLAPTLFAGFGVPFGSKYRGGIEVSLGRAGLSASTPDTPNAPSTDLGGVWQGSAMIMMDAPIRSRLRGRAGIGAIRYMPSDDDGMWAQGGTTRVLFGAGLDYEMPASTAWNVMISARYDFHRFTTTELRSRGFRLEQPVNRLSLSVGLARK